MPKKPSSKSPAKKPAAKRVKRPHRPKNPERTRDDIITVATKEFARQGLSGARVNKLAARTPTSKRMMYYYFGGKEGLYQAVLEDAFLKIRDAENAINAEEMEPVQAIRRLVTMTLDYDYDHPEFVRLMMIENLHHAKHVKKTSAMRKAREAAISRLSDILERGRKAGLFRPDFDALDVHVIISALCVFRVANQHTFKALFGRDLASPRLRGHYNDLICDVVLRLLAK
jgi:AcrR family transcriptional regulator